MTALTAAQLVAEAREYAGLDEYPGAVLIIQLADLIEQQAERIKKLQKDNDQLGFDLREVWRANTALRKVIEDAPHEHKCNSFWHRPGDCTCWKSKALPAQITT